MGSAHGGGRVDTARAGGAMSEHGERGRRPCRSASGGPLPAAPQGSPSAANQEAR